MTSICIVGVGLIGASVGLALRARAPTTRVIGVDTGSALASEGMLRAVHEAIDARDSARVLEVMGRADLVVLATPVSEILRLLPAALDRAPVVTDCGSTKRAIVDSVARHPRRAQFVPGHPMSGHAEGGAANASSELFAGRTWVLCPEGCAPSALARVEDLVRAAAAEPLRVTAAEHDRTVALTSHATQVVASALRALAARERAQQIAGPAFDRATLGAGGPEGMWKGIFETNAPETAHALGVLARLLGEVEAGLSKDPPDTATALALLAEARRDR